MIDSIGQWLSALPRLESHHVLLIILALALVRHLLFEIIVGRCPAHLRGQRCVHLKSHLGAHRDPDGNYWR